MSAKRETVAALDFLRIEGAKMRARAPALPLFKAASLVGES
jgi:hypothetical protein